MERIIRLLPHLTESESEHISALLLTGKLPLLDQIASFPEGDSFDTVIVKTLRHHLSCVRREHGGLDLLIYFSTFDPLIPFDPVFSHKCGCISRIKIQKNQQQFSNVHHHISIQSN